MLCGVEIRCVDNSRRPCLRERDHDGGHNPFSDNPPMEVLNGKASAGLSSEVEAQEAAQAEENEAGEIRCESDM